MGNSAPDYNKKLLLYYYLRIWKQIKKIEFAMTINKPERDYW